ncbi:hypothetical protein A264_27752 [Pseudomonas syringae pv. actinidiae ICMP 19071]|nr:hypothetical protein A264_27752 [Pseudomonas syringae pv. actinidiae ICMP 19071]EPM64947.1 hypothetical protein A262_00050 [Pseudomonas syringae pv. actinidiae ICMP 19073]EPM74041.1 hypothetical protein A3SO_27428 [Pseudomonas syringae pv. actinidiae ICMP 19072]OSN63687.1 hypothetical protein BV349_04347 [Pseudomonas syringae pv. actinidiae]OSN73399.1 hypothetical protein BV351_04459 [Pseudomonas syringae pv. actinidiae]
MAPRATLHYPCSGHIYEPAWRSGKAISTRIARADGELLGIAGLWEQWRDPSTDQTLHSYTMLTVNADDHDFMKAYHKPQDEKRIVVILPKGSYMDWLTARPEQSAAFMHRNFKMPMHQADAWKEASCLHSDA